MNARFSCVLTASLVIATSLPAATFTVINTNDSGAGSLRQAIVDANTSAGTDVISFNIASGGLSISPASALPGIVEPVTIDGSTQPGFIGAPLIEINGVSAGAAADGLTIATSNSVVRALVINRFLGDGIEITNGANNRIEGCYVGLNLTGLTDQGNTLNGILITNSPNNTIGGAAAVNRNYIAGNNAIGVSLGGALSTNNILLGNYIGLNITNGVLANATDGVRVNAPRNVIGGSASGSRNFISGNTGQGIEITTLGVGTIVRGNYLGTDDTGALDRGNTTDGIIANAGGVIIGGANAGEGNLISGNNGDGIELNGAAATNNVVLGNIIGTAGSGTVGLANGGHGVLITTSSRSNIIGGVLAGQANLIAFNSDDGISVVAAVSNTNNTFRGNSIFSNGDLGIDLGASGVTANDAGDGDTGANQLQNFPVLTAVTNTPAGTIIVGSISSRASTTYTLDFFSGVAPNPLGSGEGQTYLGSTNLTTDGSGINNFTIALPVVTLAGRYLSATATDNFGNTSEFATNVLAVSTIAGLTFTVVNTNDSGAGSLRQAIANANAAITAGDTIQFAITNLTTAITPASALPTITDPVAIDGYTQAGAVMNTSPDAFNGVLPVRLVGTSAGSGVNGLLITAGSSTVRGLMITGFNSDGIELSGLGGNVIQGNVIGLDAAGTDLGNTANGVFINGCFNNIIGGTSLAARNVLSGNGSDGVEVSGALAWNNQVVNNLIGSDQTGTLDRGNSGDGVFITLAGGNIVGGSSAGSGNLISGNNDNGIELSGVSATNNVVLGNRIGTTVTGDSGLPNSGDGVFITTSSRSNIVGGVLAGAANVIAFNGGDGINVAAAVANTNNTIRGNSILANGNLGIDLGANGVQLNDAGDPDTGANQLQNFPSLNAVTNTASAVVVNGTLNSRPSVTYTLDFYSSVASDPTGAGEGQTWIGATNLATGADSNLTFTVSFPLSNLAGRYVTATATDDFGNTSEFGTNVPAFSTAPGQIFTVVNTNDSGPGSLRQAIIAANAAITAGDTIVFAITNLETTISPASALPTVIDAVTIDGYTQPGAVANSSASAFTAVLPVVLNGASAGAGVDGLQFTVGGNTVRGLNIINFTQDGLDFSGGDSNTVQGCLIGLDSASVDRGNAANGILLGGSANNLIGGMTLAARNVISGNNGDGIEINGVTGSNNVIQGNLIGTDLSGAFDRGNSADGVLLSSASGSLIGGTNSTQRNVISGNSSQGISITAVSASNNVVQGNFIGLDVAGTVPLGNSSDGVFISSAPNNSIGGGTAGAANLISANGSDGVTISSSTATGNLVQGNRIGTDVTGTLDLGNSGNGVLISSAPANTIGGATVAAGNLISGNNSDGIEITGVASSANVIQNNRIGLAATGAGSVGNNGHGVFVTSSAHNNVIGGSGNTIAFSGLDGIYVASGTNNALRHNQIFSNGGLGIDLGTDGVTTNDVNDVDAGANQLQNFPVLLATTNTPTQVTFAGSLDSAASTSYDLDFFASMNPDGSGHGEGQVYLGSTNLTTDGGGHAAFLVSFAGSLTGRYVAATATDPNGNTSEFSPWAVAASTIAPTNILVTTTNDSGAGSLREAIQIANSFISAGNDTISFAIPGAGVRTINVSDPLPAISDAVTINGYSQTGASANSLCDGNNAVIRVELAGGFAPANADGLTLSGVGNSIVRGLGIRAFPGHGVVINSGTNHQIAGCFIGLDAGGLETNLGNSNHGVYIIGPATSANRIGGDSAADRNVISANLSSGITVENSARNLIAGNFIGTDASGTLDRGNQLSGVVIYLSGSISNVVGGVTGCSRNVISGNGAATFSEHYGLNLYGAVSTRVLGNYIGLDATGTQSLGNGAAGVRLRGASFNLIGDGTVAGRNIISGNGYGVELELTSPTNTIGGNYIGTDVTGSLDRGNLIYGVLLAGASYNLVLGNVISGNDNDAVNVAGSASPGNRILGNRIGLSAVGANALANQGSGVTLGQSNTQIGGTNANEGNLIAHNTGRGVSIFSGVVNCPVLGNAIYSNSSLGIDLNSDGVANANDLGDGDTGANGLQNRPVLFHALRYPTETILLGTLNSRTNAAFRLEFFNNSSADPSGFGEGQTYLGFLNVTTDGNGNASFSFTHPAALPLDNYLTATATDATNNTSEFSNARRIVPFDSVDLNVNLADSADPAPHATNFFYTITVTNAGPTNATSVFVTNILPATVAFVSATPSQGSASHGAGIVTWNVGNLNENGVAILQLEVDSTVTGRVTNSAAVVTSRVDNNPGNNSDSETTLLGIAEVAVMLLDAPDPVIAGQPVTFTLMATNAGPDAATGATLNFNVDFDSVLTGSGVSQGTFNVSGNNVFASIGTVPAGGTATLTVTAIPMVEGTNNSHFGSVSRLEFDPVFANNSASAFTTVNPGPGVIEFTTSDSSVNEGAGPVVVEVHRLGGSIGTVTVGYTTSNLTAVAGSDYTTTSGTLTFANGETSKNILIPITDDAIAECNESFTLRLFNPTGGALVLRTTNTTMTIFDNEVSASGTILALSLADANLPLDGGNQDSHFPSISSDGRYVAFEGEANNLVASQTGFGRAVFVRDLLARTTALASGGGDDSFGGDSAHALISGNGRYVVFYSARNLTTNDNNSYVDVFLRDLATETTTLLSRNAAGTGSGSGSSYTGDATYQSIISSNGQSIVYETHATDLTEVLDGNLNTEVIYYDGVAGTNRLISVNSTGTGAGNSLSQKPVVSANGQVIAFPSVATNLVAIPDANIVEDVFVNDVATGVNELLSINFAGTAAANGDSRDPYLSANGRYVAFFSSASNLVTNDSNARWDVYWQDRVAGLNVLVSVNTNGVAGNGDSYLRGISADGRYVVFESRSSDLVPGDNNGTMDVFVRDLVSNVTVLVSRNLAGTGPGNSTSESAVISGDGTHVAFVSAATNLTAASNVGGNSQVFVRNLLNQTTRLVSFRPGSTNGANARSYGAAISFNGNVTVFVSDGGGGTVQDIWAHTYSANTTELVSEAVPSATGNNFSTAHQLSASGAHVAFASHAGNLAPGDVNQTSDVFLFNLTNSLLTLISANTNGTGSGNGFSDVPDLSANGRYVAFYSTATDLVVGDTNNTGDIFRRDTLSGITALVSVNRTGNGPGNNNSSDPEITPDGRSIVFATTATNLVVNDLNGVNQDIVLRDMSSNVVELITVNANGTGTANSLSRNPVISDNGRFVAFDSLASDLGPVDGNGGSDVYVRDRLTGTNILCSRNLTGTDGGSHDSLSPVISANGLIVLFSSAATNLVAGDTNGASDIFAFDTTTLTLQLVSVALGGGAASSSSFNYSISADGRYVAFQTSATNLVANDGNGSVTDVFLRDLVAGITTLISVNCNDGASGNGGSFAPAISADGRYITFESSASDLVGGDFTVGSANLYRHDRLTGLTVLVSQNRFITGGGNGSSSQARISANGGVIAFASRADDLVANDANKTRDIFSWQGNVVASGVDLVFNKTASTNTVPPSGSFSYTLTVTNLGSAGATSVGVTDTLPAGVSFVSATSTPGTVLHSSGTVTASIGSLGVNAGARVTINVTASSAGSVSNYASATALEADATPGNNSDFFVVTVASFASPPLSIQPTNSTQLFVSWPSSTPSEFRLETTTNLAPVIVWTPVTNSVSNNGTIKFVILNVNAAEPGRFYRLKQ